MRVMTLVTHPLLERQVLHSTTRLQAFRIVALSAGGPTAALLNSECFICVGCIVAHVAACRHDWAVSTCHEQLRLVRGMGIMANHAGPGLHWVVAMCFPKGGSVAIMAGETERRLRFDQEVLLVRAVGFVAGTASLGIQHLMHVFLFIIFFLVAPVAELFSLHLEQIGFL